MRKSPEKLIAAVVAIALICLISVQVYWARRTYDQAETVFNDKVIGILNKVKEVANDQTICFAMYAKTYIDSNQGIFLMRGNWHGEKEVWDKKMPDSIPMFYNVPEEYKDSPLNRIYKDIKFSNPVTAEILLKFRYDLTRTSPDKKILKQDISTDNFKEIIKNHEALISIYDTLMIDSLLNYQLKINNIPVKYAYALVKSQTDSIEYISNRAQAKNVLASGLRIRFTPEDLFSYPYDIAFYSQNKPELILRNIVWVLSLSIGIIFFLLFGYIYFIRTILNQKKLSKIKNDFIDNMTHELNTPITNISLAYETLLEKGKIAPDEYSSRIGSIIQNETNRLKDNVTRILRISSYEKTGLGLQYQKTDVYELIKGALNRLELKINQKNANIHILKNGCSLFVYGDIHHLSNAMENLIDNALKYSNTNCKIEIELIKSDHEIIIRIKDNGIGISHEDVGKIFDKFYRVPHGNIHNSRGFGLGLNYVKNIIESHGGTISVKSRPNKGSCFQITFNENERQSAHSSS